MAEDQQDDDSQDDDPAVTHHQQQQKKPDDQDGRGDWDGGEPGEAVSLGRRLLARHTGRPLQVPPGGLIGDITGPAMPSTSEGPAGANIARVYDALLGGRDNYREDREAADLLTTLVPQIRLGALANRALLRRVVEHYATGGIDQFIDLGSGLPTVGNVHEIAHTANPDARTVYVDHDRTVVAHARALLWRNPHAHIVEADLSDVDTVMGSEAVTETLDLKKPVVLLMLAVLHFIPDTQDPTGLINRYTSHLPTGSVIVVSHATTPFDLREAARAVWGDTPPPPPTPSTTATAVSTPETPSVAAVAEAVRLYTDLIGPLIPRSAPQVANLFGRLYLDPPGVIPAENWHSDVQRPARPPEAPVLIATARIP